MQSPLNTDDSIGQNNIYQMADYTLNTNQTSCLDILGTQVGIFIQQKFEFFQVMIGRSGQSKLQMFLKCMLQTIKVNRSNKKNYSSVKKIFILRQTNIKVTFVLTLSPSFRPFEMFVSNYGCKDFQPNMDQMFQENSDRIIFKFDRKYVCTCCCLNRPRLDVQYVENGQNRNLGYIVNPFYCCTLGCHIFDSENKLKYIIEGSCCQCYFWCRFPCSEQCNHVEFHIKTPNGEVVAPMNKQVKGCCQNWADFTGNNSVVFPQNASKEDKALILAATILFEYMYFENKDGPQPVN